VIDELACHGVLLRREWELARYVGELRGRGNAGTPPIDGISAQNPGRPIETGRDECGISVAVTGSRATTRSGPANHFH